jgi:hypothetical protein
MPFASTKSKLSERNFSKKVHLGSFEHYIWVEKIVFSVKCFVSVSMSVFQKQRAALPKLETKFDVHSVGGLIKEEGWGGGGGGGGGGEGR